MKMNKPWTIRNYKHTEDPGPWPYYRRSVDVTLIRRKGKNGRWRYSVIGRTTDRVTWSTDSGCSKHYRSRAKAEEAWVATVARLRFGTMSYDDAKGMDNFIS